MDDLHLLPHCLPNPKSTHSPCGKDGMCVWPCPKSIKSPHPERIGSIGLKVSYPHLVHGVLLGIRWVPEGRTRDEEKPDLSHSKSINKGNNLYGSLPGDLHIVHIDSSHHRALQRYEPSIIASKPSTNPQASQLPTYLLAGGCVG